MVRVPVEGRGPLEEVLAATDGVDESEPLLLDRRIVELGGAPGPGVEGQGLVLLLQGRALQLAGVTLRDDRSPVGGAGVSEHAGGLARARVGEGRGVYDGAVDAGEGGVVHRRPVFGEGEAFTGWLGVPRGQELEAGCLEAQEGLHQGGVAGNTGA
jgi:hypothetical protein